MTALLQIDKLSVKTRDKVFIQDACLTINQGESVALTGASGCGKSTLFKAICRLLPSNYSISGTTVFAGTDISKLNLRQLRKFFGSGFTMILQDPEENFDDRKSILSHFEEAAHAAGLYDKKVIKDKAVELLYKMQLAYPQNLLKRRSCELSRGMCQRVILGLTLMQKPKLILADEFTCSLDLITRVQILKLLKELQQEQGFALFFITHNEDEARFLSSSAYHLENSILRKVG